MDIAAIIAALLKLAVILVPVILERIAAAKTPGEIYETRLHTFNHALAHGDADHITIAFARMRVPKIRSAGSGGDPGGPSGGPDGGRPLPGDAGLAPGAV